MIIVCPACQTKYAVPADAISAEGRPVRCTECGHSWKQMPLNKVADLSQVTPAPSGPAPMPQGSNLPVHANAPVSAGLKYNAVAMLVAAAFISFFGFQTVLETKFPFISSIYGAVGLHRADSMAIKDITASFTRTDNKLKMTFQGRLANESGTENRFASPIQIRVLSEGGNVMGMLKYAPENVKMLEPGEEVHIETTLGGLSGNTRTVLLEYGNWLERLFY